MPGWSVRARRPHGDPNARRIVLDPDLLQPHLEDAAHVPGGHAGALAIVESEAAVAQVLATAPAVLPIGAQSSLTGGATPMGELLLSTAGLRRIESIGTDQVRLEAGVVLAALDDALDHAGKYYPPAPTFAGASAGGTVATNAAGAATFKYGTTRDWVEALTVVLPTGDVLDIERGATRAHADGYFELELADHIVRVVMPRYHMPRVPKLSAGYFAAPGMDLIDLFIGSEGTLGIVTAMTLRVVPVRPAFCLALVPLTSRAAALALVGLVRRASIETRQSGAPGGIDVSAIEYMDEACLNLLREEGIDRLNGVALPSDARVALLVTLELPSGTSQAQAFDEIGRVRDDAAPDTPLIRFCRLLLQAGSLDRVEIAVPGDRRRRAQLLAVREGVPEAVNLRVARAKREVDSQIQKVAADVIVPFERLDELLTLCRGEFERRGLHGAVWGHVSDGNLHPNVIPRSLADVESGRAAMLALGREAIRLGGAPLAEHGVGRNPVKQRLLEELYGKSGIDEMRSVKRAIDPDWKLAPGVLFGA